jgi:putative ATP-dependent endonuclease of the OLD family
MYLTRLEIDNFRGIRSARLDFGETTVLIGENDSGKTTLLEAVCMILSPLPEKSSIIFRPQDFFMENGAREFSPAGPLSICLTFRERKPDEWSFMRNNDFGLALPDDVNAIQELTLEVKADPATAGEESSARWRIAIEGKNQMDYTDDPAILSWIRRLNPVFRIKSGILSNLPEEDDNMPVKNLQPDNSPDIDEKLRENIRQSYQNLISGSTKEAGEESQAGYRAALHYLGQASNLFMKDGPALEQIIYEILGRRPVNKEFPRKKVILRRGSAAEKIGMLLFTEAFLQSGSLMADPFAEPVIIIEDPEAHLHPMTLEAVKLLIERLKWQKIISTQSGNLLSGFPLEDIRRISRHDGNISQHMVRSGNLSSEEIRRLSYHVRMRQTTATFARCWLLVEGESEIWLLPHLARLCGYDLQLEGIVCIEFAQCGIPPLIKAARQLGIEWFLLADGDAAGKAYIETAKHFALQAGDDPEEHCMRFREKDIENHLFFNGYAEVYEAYAEIPARAGQNMQPRRIIDRAIHRNSKPFMAVAIVEAIARKDSPGVPPQLRKLIETCVRLANAAPMTND